MSIALVSSIALANLRAQAERQRAQHGVVIADPLVLLELLDRLERHEKAGISRARVINAADRMARMAPSVFRNMPRTQIEMIAEGVLMTKEPNENWGWP